MYREAYMSDLCPSLPWEAEGHPASDFVYCANNQEKYSVSFPTDAGAWRKLTDIGIYTLSWQDAAYNPR